MNKMEYLEQLEGCLKWKVSKAELDDIMRDYAEYFEEGRRQSKPDSEISAKLGDPEIVAQQIIEESKESNQKTKQAAFQEPHLKEPKKPRFNWLKKGLQKIGSWISRFFYWLGEAFFLFFLFPLAFVLGGVIFGSFGFVVLFGMALGFFSLAALIGGVLLMIGSGICFVMLSPQIGLTALFGTITALGIGGCASCLTIRFVRKGWHIVCNLAHNLSSFFLNLFQARYQTHPLPQYEAPNSTHRNTPTEEVQDADPTDSQEAPPSYHNATDPLYSNLQNIMNHNIDSDEAPPQSSKDSQNLEASSYPNPEEDPSPEEISLTLEVPTNQDEDASAKEISPASEVPAQQDEDASAKELSPSSEAPAPQDEDASAKELSPSSEAPAHQDEDASAKELSSSSEAPAHQDEDASTKEPSSTLEAPAPPPESEPVRVPTLNQEREEKND